MSNIVYVYICFPGVIICDSNARHGEAIMRIILERNCASQFTELCFLYKILYK